MVKFKKDHYRETRGNYSRFLRISCEHCNETVLNYQKDGPGELRRLYIDRIVEPDFIKIIKAPLTKIRDLACPKCKRVLGIPYIYKKENRKAFRLFVGATTKKIISLS